MKEKQKNLGKAREYIKTRDQVTNSAIAHLLGVSDSTAVRYLDDLEKEGLIKQVGTTGQSVYYEVKWIRRQNSFDFARDKSGQAWWTPQWGEVLNV